MEIRNSFLKRIVNYFIRGLVLFAPIYATVMIIWAGVEYLESIIPINIKVGNQILYFPGLGILIILIGIILLGFFFSTVVPQSFFSFAERLLKRVPLVSIIYYSIKDLILAFVGDNKKFNQPVLVNLYHETGVKKIGFITQNDLSHLKISDHVAVYMPFSYSLAGEVYIVPTDQVTILEASSTDVMKMLVSGGISLKVSKEEAPEEGHV